MLPHPSVQLLCRKPAPGILQTKHATDPASEQRRSTQTWPHEIRKTCLRGSCTTTEKNSGCRPRDSGTGCHLSSESVVTSRKQGGATAEDMTASLVEKVIVPSDAANGVRSNLCLVIICTSGAYSGCKHSKHPLLGTELEHPAGCLRERRA